MLRRMFLWIVLVSCLSLALVACGDDDKEDETSDAAPVSHLDEIRKADKLVVGTSITSPFEYRNADNELIGFDVNLVSVIASRLGVEVEWKEMEFADLLPELQAGNVDMVIAGMYITAARQEMVDMSDPYLDTGLVVVTRVDAPPINSMEDLAGRSVGVKEGATGETWAEQFKTEDGIDLEIRSYATTLESLDDLDAGLVDVVFNDKINTLDYMKKHPEIHIQGEVFAPASVGMAVRKGDTDLLLYLNETLADLKEGGQIDRLFDTWINPETAEQ